MKRNFAKLKKSYLDARKEKLQNALEKLKKSVHFDELIKISTQFVHQISDSVPQKIVENFAPIGFSAKINGIDSKLSVFRSVQVSSDNKIQGNLVVGCQWFGVNFLNSTQVVQNKFTAVQLTEFAVDSSDLMDSQINLSRVSHVTLQEACFTNNKISLSTLSDMSVTESDFTENSLNRCDFSGTVINSSRMSKNTFVNVKFKDCEFDSCEIQGIEFHDCDFKDCTFHQIQSVSQTIQKVSHCRFVGKQFSQCKTEKEFLDMLKGS